MFRAMSAIILFLSFHTLCFATMFAHLSFEKQVEEATSAAEVLLEDSRTFKNSSGFIMTEYSFKVLESYNLSGNDLENQKLKISMPGGTYEGVTSMIDGAPQFKVNEKSFLLLKKINSKIYLSNFSLGKFKIQDVNGKPYYVSEVFPEDPELGKISKDMMLELINSKWKVTATTPEIMLKSASLEHSSDEEEVRPLLKGLEEIDRAPAQDDLSTNKDVPLFFWGAIVSFVIFFMAIFLKLKRSGIKH